MNKIFVLLTSGFMLSALCVSAEQDDNGYTTDKITYVPALPGPGQAPKEKCNGLTTETTTYKASCEDCEVWCECDLTRTKNAETKEKCLTWKTIRVFIEVTVGSTIPAGVTLTTVDGKSGYYENQEFCGLVDAH